MAERRYTVVFLAAVVVALGATYGVYRVLDQTRASSRIPMSPVVVAAQDIPEGGRIERVAVVMNEWPIATVPAGAFVSVDSVVGRVTRIPVFKGEPIVPGRLAPSGTGPGLEVKITPGKRAMAIRISDVAGIAGLIQPNSRVDVMVTINDEAVNRQRAKLFMSNMRILSVGTQVERGADGKPIQAAIAALEVTPEESERLAIAMSQGTIQLVLRGYGDPDSIRTRGATSSDVMTQLSGGVPVARPTPAPVRAAAPRPAPRPTPPPVIVQQAPPPPRRPDSSVVQIYRGTAVSQQKIERDSTKPRP
jgi:pilus assembly protein CpaB